MRLPRKKKKQAKKLKAKADALIMYQAAVVAAQGRIQLALISAKPVQFPHQIPLKALAVVNTTMDTAKAFNQVLSQIKPWYEHVRNFKRS
jgi:hypothetical protein